MLFSLILLIFCLLSFWRGTAFFIQGGGGVEILKITTDILFLLLC